MYFIRILFRTLVRSETSFTKIETVMFTNVLAVEYFSYK